jgi:hypothetical protein
VKFASVVVILKLIMLEATMIDTSDVYSSLGREKLKERGWENYQQTIDRRPLAECEENGGSPNADKCFVIRSLSSVLYGCKHGHR